ncbi:MAG: hypothetical protein HOV80_30865 [Polyangiaceae bacterium]|nr:hypothetical protein [Polyangiaceae bacterium]
MTRPTFCLGAAVLVVIGGTISPDDSTLVVANRDAGTVSILRVDYASGLPAMTKVAELAVGAEPWQVAIDGCGERAYVAVRRDAKLVQIDALDTASPVVAGEVAVGSEPTGLAITPNNTQVYVANWVEGTVSVVDAQTLTVASTIDLNQTLIDTGLLGSSVTVSRPALAHPRSIAITNDLDAEDDDEKVVVTEFFAQRTAPESQPLADNADVNWVGLLYVADTNGGAPSALSLPPVTDTGFMAGNAGTGCFANQLQSVTLSGSHAFVTSICASPRGPLAVRAMTHPVVHAVDLDASTSEIAVLSKAFSDFYDSISLGAADPARRNPLVTNDLAFVPGSGEAFITANGADTAYRLSFDADGALVEVGGTDSNPYVDLIDDTLDPEDRGQNPNGLVIARGALFAFVVNDVTRNVIALDLAAADGATIAGLDDADARVIASTDPPALEEDQAYLRGKHAFNTGLANWSQNGQAFGACQACHFEGLSDNITWYFGRGPRQSTSLDGSFASNDPTDQRIFNWTGVFDEITDFEAVARSIDGGVAALVDENNVPINLGDTTAFPPFGAAGLNGSTHDVLEMSADSTWADIEIYIQRVRSPRAPVSLAASAVAAGKALFEGSGAGNCQGCHSGAKWTNSTLFYTPGATTNEQLKTTDWDGDALIAAGFPAVLLPATDQQLMRFATAPGGDQIQCVLRNVGTFGISPADVGVIELTAPMTGALGQGNGIDSKGFNVPSILGMSVGAPYFHAGNARTLEEMFGELFASHHRALSPDASFLLSDTDRTALVAYLLSIDESTMPIPGPATPGANGGSFCAFP